MLERQTVYTGAEVNHISNKVSLPPRVPMRAHDDNLGIQFTFSGLDIFNVSPQLPSPGDLE